MYGVRLFFFASCFSSALFCPLLPAPSVRCPRLRPIQFQLEEDVDRQPPALAAFPMAPSHCISAPPASSTRSHSLCVCVCVCVCVRSVIVCARQLAFRFVLLAPFRPTTSTSQEFAFPNHLTSSFFFPLALYPIFFPDMALRTTAKGREKGKEPKIQSAVARLLIVLTTTSN